MLKIYSNVRAKLAGLKRSEFSDLNLALRVHIHNINRDKSLTRKPLAQTLAKHFSDTDRAIAAFHILRNRLSEQGVRYFPTEYGVRMLEQDIKEVLIL